MTNVISGRTSAQLADPQTARYGSNPAAHPLIVFHFGVRFNHPLGMLAPGARETVSHLLACNAAAEARRAEYGLLGSSTWRAGERAANNALMVAYYFRDVEALNAFARSEVHRRAWEWIAGAGLAHIGFFHEAFCVPARADESIYVNCQPMRMGAASVQCVDAEDGGEKWMPALVGADVGPLRSQFGRMGRAVQEGEGAAVAT